MKDLMKTFAVTIILVFSLKAYASEKMRPEADTSIVIKNIVLVHGAFVDGSGWKGAYDILIKKGFHVSVAEQPLTSFESDITAVNRVIDM